MAVNFVAVGDGFCVTDERSVDPRHSTPAAAQRLSGAWVWGGSMEGGGEADILHNLIVSCKKIKAAKAWNTIWILIDAVCDKKRMLRLIFDIIQRVKDFPQNSQL